MWLLSMINSGMVAALKEDLKNIKILIKFIFHVTSQSFNLYSALYIIIAPLQIPILMVVYKSQLTFLLL